MLVEHEEYFVQQNRLNCSNVSSGKSYNAFLHRVCAHSFLMTQLNPSIMNLTDFSSICLARHFYFIMLKEVTTIILIIKRMSYNSRFTSASESHRLDKCLCDHWINCHCHSPCPIIRQRPNGVHFISFQAI